MDAAETKKGTNYVGVAGSGNQPAHRLDLEDVSCGDLFLDGVLTYERSTLMQQIVDGTSRSLAVGERIYGYAVDQWTYGAKWHGAPLESVCVSSIKNLGYSINANLQQVDYFVRDQSVPPERRRMVRNDLLFGSAHPHGANFAHADGSVQFLDDAIDFTVLQELASRGGQEIVE